MSGQPRAGAGPTAAEERVVSQVMAEEPAGARLAPHARPDGSAETATSPEPRASSEELEPGGEDERVAPFLDVPLEITVELGRVRLPLGELMNRLLPGAVLALDKAPESLLEVRVQSRLVALGEAISIGERCGVRIVALAKEGG